jgi:hypothetical protein
MGNPAHSLRRISVANPQHYDFGSIIWFHLGQRIGAELLEGEYDETLLLDSRIHDNRLGLHSVTVEVQRSGTLYSQTITFRLRL